MEPLEASASLRERLARLKIASRRRTARAGGVGVSDEPTDENLVVPSETRSKPFTLTDDDDVRAATFSRDRPDALRANAARTARPADDEGAADGTSRAFDASTELRSHGTTRCGHRVDDALRRKTPATKDAASEPAPATVAILRAVPLDAPGKEHVPFAAVKKVDGAVELVTTRPKTTLRKTRRFDAAVEVKNSEKQSETMRRAASLDAASSLASHENGFGLARDARAAVRDGVGSAFLFFGNRAGVSRVARGRHRPGDIPGISPGYPRERPARARDGDAGYEGLNRRPETDLGFAGLVAEALFREIAAARADAPDGVTLEFVVTLQVVADVIVALAGAASAASASAGGANTRTPSAFGLAGLSRAKTREVLRDALAEGFDDAEAFDDAVDADEGANDGVVRGGRGAGAASAAAAFFCHDASRPTRPRVREDVDAFRSSSAFFVENAVEVVVDTLDTCRACLARAFRGVARLEAEMASETSETSRSPYGARSEKKGGAAAYAGERAHVLARFDVATRRFANATNDVTTVSTDSTDSTFETSVTHSGRAEFPEFPEFPESGSRRNSATYLDDDDESAVLPFSETRASLMVCDFAGTGGNRAPTRSGGRATQSNTVPEDAALKAFFRVSDAARENTSHAPFRDSNVTKLLSSALGGGDRLRCCFGARDGVAVDASPTEKKFSFENLDATLARAQTVAEAFGFGSARSRKKPKQNQNRTRFTRHEMVAAKRAVSELGRVALGREDALASGMRSTDIELDMDGSDALVALRDALARLERVRRDARRVAETREATERLFARFGMC